MEARTSSFLRTSILEDDSDDDNDILSFSAFSKNKTKSKSSPSKQQTPLSLTQSTQNSTDTEGQNGAQATTLTPEQIESRAQNTVRDLSLDLVRKIDRIDQIGWYVTKSATKTKGQIACFPCRLCPQEEITGVFPDGVGKSKLPIRYLGWHFQNRGQFDQVTASTFYPLGPFNGNHKDNPDNEKRLQLFLDQNFDETDLVARRTDELVLRAMWNRVQLQQDDKEKKKDESRLDGKSSAGEPTTKTIYTTPPSKRARPEDDHNSSSDSDPDEADDQELEESDEPSSTKVQLRPGDHIRYYDPIGIAGNSNWLRETTIIGIDAKNKKFPLNLEDGRLLDRDHQILRLQKMHRGKLIDEDAGIGFRSIANFSLRTSGRHDMVGFRQQVEHARKSRKEHTEAVDKFWQDDLAGNENASPEENKKQKSDRRKSQLYKSLKTPSKEQVEDAVHPWQFKLTQLLNETEEQMETKKRYQPNMLPTDLRLVMDVWTRLQSRIDRGQHTSARDAISALAGELDISMFRMETIMEGNNRRKLSEANTKEVVDSLQAWLKDLPPLEDEFPREIRNSFTTPSRTSFTSRRKRYSQELAQSLSDIYDDEEMTTPATPGTSHKRRRTLSSTAPLATSAVKAKQRSSDLSVASARKRRRSEVGLRASQTRDIFRETPATPNTASKKRPARPAYEPPSVKRRKKQLSGQISRSFTSESTDTVTKERRRRDSASQALLAKQLMIEEARKNLQSAIKEVKEATKTKRRYKPHMTVEQLQVALSVWDKLSKSEPHEKVEGILTDLSMNLNVSHRKLVRFLQGDRGTPQALSERNVLDIFNALQTWIVQGDDVLSKGED